MGSNLYDGILKPGPQGGIYAPGPDVQFPNSSSTVARVTPEGLNVNKVQTVAIDPMTGSPITVGGKSDNNTILHPGAPPANYGSAPLGYSDSGQIVRTLNPNGSYSAPLQAATTEATSGYVPQPWAPSGPMVFPDMSTGGLVFGGPANQPSAYTGGDPWQGLYSPSETINGVVRRPGMVTGPIMASTARSGGGGGTVATPIMSSTAQQVAASNDPNRGQKIHTNNNGDQVVGSRLNGSPSGYTVTGDSWFNDVRGL